MEFLGWIIGNSDVYDCVCWTCVSNHSIGSLHSRGVPALRTHRYIRRYERLVLDCSSAVRNPVVRGGYIVESRWCEKIWGF